MLIEQMSDPYFRLMVIGETLDAEEKDHLVRKAFLHIIATRDACQFQKIKALDKILEVCPDAIDGITDEAMIEHLGYLRDNMLERHELISTPELEWVAKYVRSSDARIEAEKLVYSAMLLGSDHWDKHRREFKWSILESECIGLIKKALQSDGIGSKRKMQLAKEIGEPTESFARPYFRKLLWDRHYDLAEGVGVKFEDDIIAIIMQNLNAGYFSDALMIVQRFLPDRQDLIDEIQQIINAFKEV
jgi:hypothetical protein